MLVAHFMPQQEPKRIWDRRDSEKLAESLSARHMLFWSASPSDERRDLRLARIGSVISIALLSFAGLIELIFVVSLIWQLVT